MVIYADILFILNMIIDYLLINLTLCFIKKQVGLIRQIISSVIGGLSSFYIFFESEIIIIDFAYRLFIALVMMLVLLGFKRIKTTIKATVVYIVISLTLSGVIGLIATSFSVRSVALNNTFFYVGISPVMLAALSAVFFIISKVIYRLRKNTQDAEFCEVVLEFADNSIAMNGLIDSGNSITDILSDSEIFISEEEALVKLTGMRINELFSKDEFKMRCRLIPTQTVGGQTTLPAFRCDKGRLILKDTVLEFDKPILAISSNLNSDDYQIIIPKGALRGR